MSSSPQKTTPRLYEPAILGMNDQSVLIAALIASHTSQRVKIFDYTQSGESIEDKLFHLIHQINAEKITHFSITEMATLLLPRNYKNHWHELNEHNLIFECYPENEKKGWLSRLAPAFNRQALIITVSNGMRISEIMKALPAGLRPHLIGAHFFLSSKHNRLVEIIPSERSEPQLIQRIQSYLKKSLGRYTIITEDNPNYVADRLLTFAISNGFYHAEKHQLSLAVFEKITHILTGNRQGGLCAILDHIGLDHFKRLQQSLTDLEHPLSTQKLPNAVNTLILQDNYGIDTGKGFYEYSDHPQFLFSSQEEIDPNIVEAIEATDWHKLRAIDHPQGRFVSNFLRDLWQYMMRLSQKTQLKGDTFDQIFRHGFSWNIGPYILLQVFSPSLVYETTLTDKAADVIDYPVSNLWKRRARTQQKNQVTEDFLSQCSPLKQNECSRWLVYKNKMLIWAPYSDILSFYIPTLLDLNEAIATAQKKGYGLMIYHHGSQFGGAKSWRQKQTNADDYRTEHKVLRETLLALRKFPYPFILSVSGLIMDYGFAIMMQADRVVCDHNISWRLRAIEHQLPAVGGIWFEWLRRLPHLSKELECLQIHTVLCHLLNSGGIRSLISAKELGILRSHDRVAVNRKDIPKLSQTIANAWIDVDLSRPICFPLHKLDKASIAALKARSHESKQPLLYEQFIELLGEDQQNSILSLRQLLSAENDLFQTLYSQNQGQQ